MQVTHTLGLLSVLASREEHTQHWEGGLIQWSPRQSSHHPISWKPTEDDIKICFLPSHDGESPDYTWVPSSLSGQIHPTLALIWEHPQACVVSRLQLQGLDQSQALHWGHGSALATLVDKESLSSKGDCGPKIGLDDLTEA